MGYELQYQLFALIFQVMINQKKHTNKNDCIYHLAMQLDNLINFYSSVKNRLMQCDLVDCNQSTKVFIHAFLH